MVLIIRHTLILRHALQPKSLAAFMVAGVVVLVVMTHVGLRGR
jgi:hypothetical protein